MCEKGDLCNDNNRTETIWYRSTGLWIKKIYKYLKIRIFK